MEHEPFYTKLQQFEPEIETAERERWLAEIESTPGYANLSSKQKQYILVALMTQQRAERATDEKSCSNLVKTPSPMRPQAPKDRPYIYFTGEHSGRAPYHESQLRVVETYCTDVPSELEKYACTDQPEKAEWISAGDVNSYEELKELLTLAEESITYPMVLQIAKWQSPYGGFQPSLHVRHVTIVLGANKDGDIVVWEKSGAHLPYRVATLQEVYNIYAKSDHWQVRALQTKSGA
jgi:hypothetical protein